jgi:acetyl esterase/lipase
MDAAALDRAYDNAAAFPDVPAYRALWQARSASLAPGPDAMLDLPYGPDARQKLDIFPAGRANAPTLLFFHGGFWSRNDKTTFRFLRDAFAHAGFNAAFAGTRLAPDVSLDEIAEDAAAACIFLRENLRALGLAERDLVLAGWSSGAHLVAQLVGRPGIAAGIAISGLYDPRPLQLSSLNQVLRLDADSAHRNAPILHPPRHAAPLLIAYGGDELPEFQRQSIDFHATWAAAGLDVRLLPLPGRHHHASLEELHVPDGLLAQRLLALREGLK